MQNAPTMLGQKMMNRQAPYGPIGMVSQDMSGNKKRSGAAEPVYPSAGYGNLSFNGTTKQLNNITNSVDIQMATGDFTVEFWMYPTGGLGSYVALEIGRPAGVAGVGFQIDIVSGIIQVYYGPLISTNLTGISVSANTWYHVALTRSGGNLKLFVNGTQAGSTVSDTTNYNQSYLWIGANSPGTNTFYSGYLTNIRVIKGTSIYNSNFTPSTKPLTAIPGTTLLVSANSIGTTATDVSTSNFSLTNVGGVSYDATTTPFTT